MSPRVSILGVGVTEAGLSSAETPVMKNLYDLLRLFSILMAEEGPWNKKQQQDSNKKICVICTDNVPNNGDVIKSFLLTIASSNNDTSMTKFLETNVAFLNSMVDRITAQREGSNGMIPRCEPQPSKALVVLDPGQDLPPSFKDQPGVVVRNTEQQLDTDIALKLRIANGTHTAIAHTLALLKHPETDVLSSDDGKIFMTYLDSLVDNQIIPAATISMASKEEAVAVWEDWRGRLCHPHFGLSSFFITQNGSAKGGIRFGPTVTDLLNSGESSSLKVSIAFAYAALLRFLTPLFAPDDGLVAMGWLDGFKPKDLSINKDGSEIGYADGLHYNFNQGWYEFKCPLDVTDDDQMVKLIQLLYNCRGKQPGGCVKAVKDYLVAAEGGNLGAVASKPGFEPFAKAIATLYSRMLAGDGLLQILKELESSSVGGIGFESPCTALVDDAAVDSQVKTSHLASGRERIINFVY